METTGWRVVPEQAGYDVLRAIGLCLLLTFAPAAHLLADGRARLSGIVADAKSGRPIASAVVRVVPRAEAGGIDGRNKTSFEARGGEDGRFDFADLAPGTYLVAVRAEGRPLTYGPAVVLERDAWRKDLRLSVERGASVHGVVLTMDGAPIPEAVVEARSPIREMWIGAPMSDEPVAVAFTDASGHFTLQGLSFSHVNLSATRLGFATRTLGGVAVSANVPRELRLHLAGGLKGEVYRWGSPVAEVNVSALGLSASTSDTGRFTLSGLPPGRINVRIGGWPPNGSEFVEFQEFVIREGEMQTVRIDVRRGEGMMSILNGILRELLTTRPSVVWAERPLPVDGVVSMPDGSPAFPAMLRFPGGRSCTDTDGRFRFIYDRERLDVLAWMPGWALDSQKNVRMGADLPPIRMTLRPQALLRVHVKRGKETLAGARIVVDGIPGSVPEYLESDADGVLFLDSLPAGVRSVRASSGGETWEKIVTLVAGEIADVTLGGE